MTDNRTTELLPCPWCGKRQAIHKEFGGWILNTTSHDRKCIMRKLLSFGMGGGLVFTSKAEAIAAWNTSAELGSETTTMTTDADSQYWYSCDTCDADGYAAALPNYCPNCGRKVVSA